MAGGWAKKLAGDTGGATGGAPTTEPTGGDNDPAGAGEADAATTPTPTTPDPAPTGPATCVSWSASQVCSEATADGVQCGPVVDECGRTETCDGVAGFGCKAGETCSATQQCVPPSTTPSGATPPSTTAPPVADTLPAPGDRGDRESPSEDDSSAGTKSAKSARSAAEPQASAGCSVSSPTRSGDGLHLLGVALVLGALRRRKLA